MKDLFDYSSLMFSMIHIIKRYCTPGYYLEKQLHDFHHILFVESGEGVLMREDGEIPISKNMFIYNPPDVPWGYPPRILITNNSEPHELFSPMLP